MINDNVQFNIQLFFVITKHSKVSQLSFREKTCEMRLNSEWSLR